MTPSTELPGLRQTQLPQGKHLGLQKPQDATDDASERPDFSGLMAALRNGKPTASDAEGVEVKPSDGDDAKKDTDPVFNGSFNLLAFQADRSIKAPNSTLPEQSTDEEAVVEEATDPAALQTPMTDGTSAQNQSLTASIDAVATFQPGDQIEQASVIGEATPLAFAAPAAPPSALQPAPGAASTLARRTSGAEAFAATLAPAGQSTTGLNRGKAQRESGEAAETGLAATKDQDRGQTATSAFTLSTVLENRPATAPRDGQAFAIDVQPKNAEADAALPKTTLDTPQPVTGQAQGFGGLMTSAAQNDPPVSIDAPQQITEPSVISTTDPNWEVEFVDSIVAQVSGDNAVIELALTPDNLGKVEVRVELRDGRADVSFVTETREAARLFAQAEGRLSDLMERHGLDLAGQNSSHRDAQARPSTNTQPQHISDGEAASPVRIAPTGRVNLVA